MAEQRDRLRELEARLLELKSSETGIILIELLKAEYKKLIPLLVSADDPVLRGKIQQIQHYLKMLPVNLILE